MKQKNQQFGRSGLWAACALVCVSGFSQAAPVTSWSYTTDDNFTAATFQPSGSGTTVTSPDVLKWGATGGNFQVDTGDANTNQSALTIGTGVTGASRMGGGPATGSINTAIGVFPTLGAGQIGSGISITHWNNPISGGFKTLLGGTLLATLTLTPTLPVPEYAGALPVPAPTLSFNFNFQETPNAGAYGAGGFGNAGSAYCANGVLASSYPQGCPDLFGFGATTLNNSFLLMDFGDDGVAGGSGANTDFMRTYFASIFVLDTIGGAFPIQQLVAGECSAIGLSSGCFGFRTPEAAQTTVQFAFAVTTEPISVPEPGSLALLGLGITVMGMLRQRKAKQAV